METLIRAENLTRCYGPRLAAGHISFSVRAGEIFGFLGPNGAGKTTTQRVLVEVLPPGEGSVQVLDHDMVKDPLARQGTYQGRA